jgi:hypothetical protein
MSVTWTDTLTPALEAIKKRLATDEYLVKVGLPDDPHLADDGKVTGLTLGEAARINEFGSEDGRIPERPAWRMGLAHGQKEFNRLNEVNLHLVALGRKSVDQALGELGAMGAARVKMEIRDGDFVPNAPSTIARKGSSHPLVDTAQTRQSITWEVVK